MGDSWGPRHSPHVMSREAGSRCSPHAHEFDVKAAWLVMEYGQSSELCAHGYCALCIRHPRTLGTAFTATAQPRQWVPFLCRSRCPLMLGRPRLREGSRSTCLTRQLPV